MVISVVTQVLVDVADPAFLAPTKPIGSFMDEATARLRESKEGWSVTEDAGRGYRRVIASPRPQRIIEFEAIRHLVEEGFVVVAAGGGGIPVVEGEDGALRGVDAVIDKDLASSVLAHELGADTLLISTAADHVYLNFGKPDQQMIEQMTVAEARRWMAEGQFGVGSMAPKVQAAIEFLEGGGAEAIITNPENLPHALEGIGVTRIVP